MFDVAHGAGLAAIWASWARYVKDADIKRFEEFAVNVLHAERGGSPDDTAENGIKAMERYFSSVGMPVSVHDMGIDLTEEQIQIMSLKCSRNGQRTVGKIKKLGSADIARIFEMAR
jgi:alcohol dehydrogenase YqhD (iron-dependent ADH family)